jgi:GT2 family glycosyltransferase
MTVKPYAYPAAKKTILEHLDKRGLAAEVLDGFALGAYRVKYRVRPLQKVSLVIPTKDQVELLKGCVSSVLARTQYEHFELVIVDNQSQHVDTQEFLKSVRSDKKVRVLRYDQPFNFSAINNHALRSIESEYVVFLNNDTEVISPDWLTSMLEFAQREDVGAVGAKLYYPNDTVQHAGVVIGLGGVAGHVYRGFPRSSNGDMGRLRIVQNVSAVTAACMMMRRTVFDEVGGFDERLSHAFNDVDLCLRMRERGYLMVFTPFAELYHHESASRGYDLETPERTARFVKEVEFMKTRWKHVLDAGDPYYNPNITLDRPDFSLGK